MFGLFVDTFGAIELDTVHRFRDEWEREARLRLRRGDTEVLDVYTPTAVSTPAPPRVRSE